MRANTPSNIYTAVVTSDILPVDSPYKYTIESNVYLAELIERLEKRLQISINIELVELSIKQNRPYCLTFKKENGNFYTMHIQSTTLFHKFF